MNLNIHIGWWVLPLAITIVSFFWMRAAGKFEQTPSGHWNLDIGPLIFFMAWLIGNLFVWLIWAVLT